MSEYDDKPTFTMSCPSNVQCPLIRQDRESARIFWGQGRRGMCRWALSDRPVDRTIDRHLMQRAKHSTSPVYRAVGHWIPFLRRSRRRVADFDLARRLTEPLRPGAQVASWGRLHRAPRRRGSPSSVPCIRCYKAVRWGYRDTAAGRFGALSGTAEDGKTRLWLSHGADPVCKPVRRAIETSGPAWVMAVPLVGRG